MLKYGYASLEFTLSGHFVASPVEPVPDNGSSGFAVVLGVRADARTPKTTEIPNEPRQFTVYSRYDVISL